MEPADLATGLVVLFLLCLALFPARAVYVCLRDERRAEVGYAVFWSITRTAFGFGLPLLIGFLFLLASDGPAGGGSGIMSKSMGVGLLLVLGILALALLWACALFIGFVAARAVRMLPAPTAAVWMALSMCLAPAFAAGVYTLQSFQSDQEREHRRRWNP